MFKKQVKFPHDGKYSFVQLIVGTEFVVEARIFEKGVEEFAFNASSKKEKTTMAFGVARCILLCAITNKVYGCRRCVSFGWIEHTLP